MKKGDKIRFNGYQGEGTYNYHNTTVGKIYEIEEVDIYSNGEKAYLYRGDNGEKYIWRAYRVKLKNDFTLVQAEQIKPKVGDKIIYKGTNKGLYKHTEPGKEYEIVEIRKASSHFAVFIDESRKKEGWNFETKTCKDDFTLVPAQDTAIPTAAPALAPVARDLNTLQEGDIIKFMGAPSGANRYRDTTIGKEYEITETLTESGKIVVKYRDDVGDLVSWKPSSYGQIYYFKVMTEQRLYKDDVLATAPTLQDLKTTLDMALLLNDIQWAQETYEQIQQMEGEHA